MRRAILVQQEADMVSFISTFSGFSTNVLDMTDALAPVLGTVFFGLFLTSLAGIVVTILVDRWRTQRYLGLDVVSETNAGAFLKAA